MIIVLLPAYREAKNLVHLIPQIDASIKEKYEIIVVNDPSGDGTKKIIEKFSQYPITFLERKKKEGFGKATIDGLKIALAKKPEFIIQMDADRSHSPKDIPVMLKKAREGYDVVIGSRYVRGGNILHWSLYRKFLSKLANAFARKLLKLPAKDVTGAYRTYNPFQLQKIDFARITSFGYTFQEEILYLLKKQGAKIKEIPITYTERTTGKSNMPKLEMITGAYKLLRVRLK